MPRVTTLIFMATSVFFFQTVHAGAQKDICVLFHKLRSLLRSCVSRRVCGTCGEVFRGTRVGEVRQHRTALKFVLSCYIEIFAITS